MFFKVITSRTAGKIGKALVTEGCTLPSVLSLSRCNRARDFDRLELRHTPLLQGLPRYTIQIPVVNPDGVGLTERAQELVLPHELFNYLHEHAPGFFHRTFGTAELADFWRRQDPSRLARHPQLAGGDSSRVVPLQLYGDDVAVCKTVKCLVMLFRSCSAFRLPALEALLPISSTVLKHVDRRSLQEVFSVIRWSLMALATGDFPDRDHRGEEWHRPEDSRRQAVGGTPLADGWRALFWESVGDWEWLAKTYGLDVWQKYYLCREICHRCFACVDGQFSFRTLDYDSPIWAPEMQRALADLLAAVAPQPELVRFEGFDLAWSLLWDWMHCSALGVQHKAAGAVLVELCIEGRFGNFGGQWRIRTGIALKRAHSEFTAWARGQRIEHSQQQFTCASLSVAGGIEEVPHLKGKAHNVMTVTKWLAHILRDDRDTAHRRNRSRVLWALALWDTIFSTAGLWLDDQEAAQVEVAQSVFFTGWRWLYEEARGQMWPILPKHHAMMHIIKDCLASRRNPGSYWCFAGEHLMGLCKRSLGLNFQRGIERRMLRASLFRLSVVASNF